MRAVAGAHGCSAIELPPQICILSMLLIDLRSGVDAMRSVADGLWALRNRTATAYLNSAMLLINICSGRRHERKVDGGSWLSALGDSDVGNVIC